MNSNNPTVTNGPWSAGSMSGSGIPGHELQPCRILEGSLFKDGRFRILKGQLYGLCLPLGERKELERLFLLYGYTKRYSRNTCRFVMSRAARKRGYTTSDWRYLSQKERQGK